MAIVAFVLVVPFFINQASEEQYGLASIGFSLLTISTALDVAFGYVFVQSFGRRYARGKDIAKSPTLGLFSFYINFSIGFAVFGIAIVSILGLSVNEILMYACLAALFPALCISGCVAAIFQARNQLKPINLSRFSFELSKVLALAVSAIIAEDISLIGPVLLLTAYVRSAFDMHLLKKKTGIRITYRMWGVNANRRYWQLVRYGMHSLFMAALMLPINIGDKVIIKNLFGSDSVAYYSIAFDISTKAYFLVNAVNSAMFSVVLHRYARKTSSFAPIMVGLSTVTVLSFVYYLPLSVFAPQLLGCWLNEKLSANSVPLLRIMTSASVLYLYANVFETTLTAMGRAKSLFYVYFVGVVVYWISVSLSTWQQSLSGFMFSYLALCITLFGGFLLIYIFQVKAVRNNA